MRAWFLSLVTCVAMLAMSASAGAQGVNLSDGSKYASLSAYLAGTWKWERQTPRQSMIMRFGPGTTFFFHNFTVDLQHWGTYQATQDKLTVFLTRSCADKSTNCQDRSSPEKMEFDFTPTSANVFTSSKERWDRMK